MFTSCNPRDTVLLGAEGGQAWRVCAAGTDCHWQDGEEGEAGKAPTVTAPVCVPSWLRGRMGRKLLP